MKYYIYILSAALYVATMAGCTEQESPDGPGKQEVGSKNSKAIPEGYFVATFSPPAATRAEPDFGVVTGEDERVFDLRYLIYDEMGNFVRERLIFDDFDDDVSDNIQDWPLAAITDTLPVGHYRAVFVTNTDPDIFQKGNDSIVMNLPLDLLSDYKLGFDQARLNLPYLLGADDPDFFMDVIEFSHEDPSETVYLQRIVGIFKAYRSLVDIQDGLDMLVASLVDNLKSSGLLEEQVAGILPGVVGDAVGGVLGLVPLHLVVDPIVEILLGSVVDLLYDVLLETLIDQVGGILQGNNNDMSLLNLLDPLLNPWYHAKGAIVTVSNQPTQFGFDMEVKTRDPAPHSYYIPIVDAVVGGREKRVVVTKYLGFVDLDHDNAGEQLMTINSINAAIPGIVGGLLLDGVVDGFLLDGALFDIEDPLDFNAPNNLQAFNEYSLADLGLEDYDQNGDGLTLELNLGDVANLSDALSVLNFKLNPIMEIPLGDLLGKVVLDQLLNLKVPVPLNLPLLNLSNLDVAGSWDPENTLETTE